jgi:16S rRNA (guanine(527)-N(7))-methyltransferase GidB
MSNPAPPDGQPGDLIAAEGFGPAEFQAATGVSRETLQMLAAYTALLEEWNARHNLVSETTMPEVWHRHILDSAQIEPFLPNEAKSLIDLGSGAGFPGLVLAILRRGSLKVTLCEATTKKADFLAAVSEALGLGVKVCNARIEAAAPEAFDVVTARAFAPLDALLGYAHRFTTPQTICLLLKGGKLAEELTQAQRHWNMRLQKHPSKTHPLGVILEVRDLRHVSKSRRPR